MLLLQPTTNCCVHKTVPEVPSIGVRKSLFPPPTRTPPNPANLCGTKLHQFSWHSWTCFDVAEKRSRGPLEEFQAALTKSLLTGYLAEWITKGGWGLLASPLKPGRHTFAEETGSHDWQPCLRARNTVSHKIFKARRFSGRVASVGNGENYVHNGYSGKRSLSSAAICNASRCALEILFEP